MALFLPRKTVALVSSCLLALDSNWTGLHHECGQYSPILWNHLLTATLKIKQGWYEKRDGCWWGVHLYGNIKGRALKKEKKVFQKRAGLSPGFHILFCRYPCPVHPWAVVLCDWPWTVSCSMWLPLDSCTMWQPLDSCSMWLPLDS